MANGEPSVVLEGYSYLECPRWHEGRLWVSDFYTHRVLATDGGGSADVVAEVPNQPAGLGWLPDGPLLVVSMRDRKVLRREGSGELVEHADLSGLARGHANDMLVDGDGRAYVGSFGFDLMGGARMEPSVLVRVDPDGAATVAAEDLMFPNGMVLLPGGTLVVAETFGNRLTAFDVGPGGGLTGRRAWATFGDPPQTDDVTEALGQIPVAPDGICADAEGAIWVADALNRRVLRVLEGGEIAEEIQPGDGVYACMLGGDDGRTLFMCTAPSFAEHERRDVREARLLSRRVDVPRAGLP
jgi:sugar lactone lactonase YvrE